MNALRMMAVLVVLGLAAVAQAEDKKDAASKEKLIGTWEVVKSDGGNPPVGAVFTFGEGGKLKVSHKKDAQFNLERTFKVEGDKLTVTIERDGKERAETTTIKTLTETDFVVENRGGRRVEFKRKK